MQRGPHSFIAKTKFIYSGIQHTLALKTSCTLQEASNTDLQNVTNFLVFNTSYEEFAILFRLMRSALDTSTNIPVHLHITTQMKSTGMVHAPLSS